MISLAHELFMSEHYPITLSSAITSHLVFYLSSVSTHMQVGGFRDYRTSEIDFGVYQCDSGCG